MTETPRNQVRVTGLEVFLDLREQGYRDVVGGTLFEEEDGALSFCFGHSLIADYGEDDWVGTHDHQTGEREFEYIFRFFGHGYEPNLQRMLRLKLRAD